MSRDHANKAKTPGHHGGVNRGSRCEVLSFAPGAMTELILGLSKTSPMPSQSVTLLNSGGVMQSMHPSFVVDFDHDVGTTRANLSRDFLSSRAPLGAPPQPPCGLAQNMPCSVARMVRTRSEAMR
jgi:hypothetical protein